LSGRQIGGSQKEGVDLLELLRGHGLLRAEGLGQPGLGGAEVAGDGGAADVEELRDLFAFETAEVAQFDDLGFAGIEAGEFFECLVEGDDLGSVIGGVEELFFEGDLLEAAAPFGGIAGAGVVDEDVAHGAGGDAEEVGAGMGVEVAGVGEAEIGLVNEGGGGEGVAGGFAAEEGAGDAAEFVVDEGEELFAGL